MRTWENWNTKPEYHEPEDPPSLAGTQPWSHMITSPEKKEPSSKVILLLLLIMYVLVTCETAEEPALQRFLSFHQIGREFFLVPAPVSAVCTPHTPDVGALCDIMWHESSVSYKSAQAATVWVVTSQGSRIAQSLGTSSVLQSSPCTSKGPNIFT